MMRKMRKAFNWVWHDFNDWFGTAAARILTSMGCFWIVFALTVVPLFSQRPQGVIGWIQYVIQTIFQGAALPLLGYVSEKGSQAVMVLIRQMHEALVGKMDKTVEDIDTKVTRAVEILQADNAKLVQVIEGQAAMLAAQADMMAEMEEVIQDQHELMAELHDHHIGGRNHKFRKKVK